MNYIYFPEFGWYFDPSRVAFEVFGFPVYWYGILIGIGFILAVVFAMMLFKRIGISPDDIIDGMIVIVPLSIIGARLYFVLFNLSNYNSFWEIFDVRDGGLAIYGGVIVAFLSTIMFCKIKKLNYFDVADVVGVAFLIAQSVGRWGNFFNREAYGSETTLPWRMEIYDAAAGGRICVHPTFFYESLWCLIGFVLLFVLFNKRKFSGQIVLSYFMWYGFERFFIEGLRADSLMLGSLRVSQVLSLLLFVTAAAVMRVKLSKLKSAASGVGSAQRKKTPLPESYVSILTGSEGGDTTGESESYASVLTADDKAKTVQSDDPAGMGSENRGEQTAESDKKSDSDKTL